MQAESAWSGCDHDLRRSMLDEQIDAKPMVPKVLRPNRHASIVN
jgi:hypothetical protein